MSTLTKLENGKYEIKLEVEKSVWLDAQEKAFEKLSKKVEIKGFRKGQAPKSLIKKQLNEQSILVEAMESLLDKQYSSIIDEHDLEVIDQPELKVDQIDANELKLTFIVEVAPEVELKKYTDLGYKKPRVTVTNDEIEKEIENLRKRYANMEVKDGAIETGDTAVIDFEGFKDGVAFAGGKAENHNLVIGSNSFIPGFEDALIGLKAGDEKDVELTFPENYHAEELKGKAVVFKVKVNDVKKEVLPELNDEFVKELNIETVENVEDLKKNQKEKIKASKQETANSKAEEELYETLVKENDFVVPLKMIEAEAKTMVQEFAQKLSYQGMKFEDYLKYFNQTTESILESYKPEAEKRIKLRTILKAIVKKENIEVSDNEVEKELKIMSDTYKMPVEEIKKYVKENELKFDLAFRKAIELIKK